MTLITQRQVALALISIIFFSLVIIFISILLLPNSLLTGQQNRYALYLFITVVLWLINWFDLPFARQLTLLLITLITAVSIPTDNNVLIPQGVLVPSILAMALTGIPGIVGSAVLTWVILLWRTGSDSVFTEPAAFTVFALAISGLVLGRLVVNAHLAHERDLLQALMDNIPDFIYFKDLGSRFSRVNRAHAKLFGASNPSELIGKTDFDFQPHALSQDFFLEEQEMMKTGQPIIDRIEYNPSADGRPRWLSATKAPIRDKKGTIHGMVGISRDVTDRALMEQALADSERNYREIFNATGDAIFIHDARTGAILDVNDRMLEMYGYTHPEALAATIETLSQGSPPYSMPDAVAWAQKTIAEGPQVFEWRARHKDGTLFWVEVALRSSKIGGHGRVLAVVRDISERKQAEEALRLSEELFAKAFRSSRDAISISTLADGRLIEINDSHTRIFGYSREEAIGQTSLTLNLFAHPKDRQRLLEELNKNGEVHEMELVGRHKSGRHFEALFSAGVIQIQGDPCLVGTVRDITAQKEAEAALQAYAQELERSNQELENFAHVASHDLQEPLRKVQAFSSRLLEKYGDQLDERGQDYLRRMDNAAGRMKSLIQDMLAYARISTRGSTFAPVSLQLVLQAVLHDMDSRLEATQGRVISSPLPTVEADSTQMHQLWLNLISNGLKFHQPDTPPVIRITHEIKTVVGQAAMLHMEVADNGIGFDEVYLPKLFTMFQRLHGRDKYEGTGIGLAICRRIVERHHGTITARSQPGQGSTFIITLPVKQSLS